MSNMDLKLLEQKVTVMQNETSQVIGEIQVTLQGFAKMVTIALRTIEERLRVLENNAKVLVQNTDEADVPKPPREGTEL